MSVTFAMAVFNWFQYPPARCQRYSLHPGICNKHVRSCYGHLSGCLLSIWTAYRMHHVTNADAIFCVAIITRCLRNNQCLCNLFLVSLFISVSPVLAESGRLLGGHIYCLWSLNSWNSWTTVTQLGERMNFWGGSKKHTTSHRTLKCLTPDLEQLDLWPTALYVGTYWVLGEGGGVGVVVVFVYVGQELQICEWWDVSSWVVSYQQIKWSNNTDWFA